MASASLVATVHSLSRQLNEVCRELPGQDPLELFSSKEPVAWFLFEIKVLWILVVQLARDNWTIDIVARDGRFVYARTPRRKSDVSYFTIRRGPAAFHLVHGSQIDDVYGQPRAPDISLQHADSGERPHYQHVRAIWDAKLRGESADPDSHRISDQEFARFVLVKEWLRLPDPGGAEDVLEGWPPAFEVSALVTNGRPPSEPSDVLLERGVSVTQHFSSADTPCAPSRLQHIAHASEVTASALPRQTSASR